MVHEGAAPRIRPFAGAVDCLWQQKVRSMDLDVNVSPVILNAFVSRGTSQYLLHLVPDSWIRRVTWPSPMNRGRNSEPPVPGQLDVCAVGLIVSGISTCLGRPYLCIVRGGSASLALTITPFLFAAPESPRWPAKPVYVFERQYTMQAPRLVLKRALSRTFALEYATHTQPHPHIQTSHQKRPHHRPQHPQTTSNFEQTPNSKGLELCPYDGNWNDHPHFCPRSHRAHLHAL